MAQQHLPQFNYVRVLSDRQQAAVFYGTIYDVEVVVKVGLLWACFNGEEHKNSAELIVYGFMPTTKCPAILQPIYSKVCVSAYRCVWFHLYMDARCGFSFISSPLLFFHILCHSNLTNAHALSLVFPASTPFRIHLA